MTSFYGNPKTRHRPSVRWTGFVLLPGVVIGFILAGCASVGPDYHPVEPNVPQEWNTELQEGLSATDFEPQTLACWWTTLNDAKLEDLVERAVQGNLDIKEALARIREARAQRGIEQASLFPTLDISGLAMKMHDSKNSGTGKTHSFYETGFDAGWELDIFGGARRAIEAAQADLEATQEDLHDVLVSLLGEVALNYIESRTYQARLEVIRADIEVQEQTYQLNLSRYKAGIIDELPVQQSLYNLEHTRSQVPTLQTGLELSLNRLAVLLGETPGTIHEELSRVSPIPVPPASVAVGIPADTLRHRPDIRRAERHLAAATARIGVATADLYPRFRLSGTFGLESLTSDDFFERDSRTWGIGPSVSWNIFDAGAIRQNIDVKTARQEQALIHYESAVLKAQEEVENALVAYAKEQHRRRSLRAAVTAARQACNLATDQYQAGLVDFNNVLDAQRSLQSFQDEQAASEGAVSSNLVRLYKALGGGWDQQDQEADTESQVTKNEIGK